jgi:hypothetical protein
VGIRHGSWPCGRGDECPHRGSRGDDGDHAPDVDAQGVPRAGSSTPWAIWHLRALGFLKNQKGEVVEAPLEDEPSDDEEPSPAPEPIEPTAPVVDSDPVLPPPFTE